MKYYAELSFKGDFPSGVEHAYRCEIPERLYDLFLKALKAGLKSGVVKESTASVDTKNHNKGQFIGSYKKPKKESPHEER
jgi:hypothetical protein